MDEDFSTYFNNSFDADGKIIPEGLVFNFQDLLRKILLKEGFDEADTKILHPNFTAFLYLSIMELAKMLKTMKRSVKENLTKEESHRVDLLKKVVSLPLRTDMINFLQLFNQIFPSILNFMVIRKRTNTATSDDNDFLLDFVSKAFMLLSESFFSFGENRTKKYILSKNNCSTAAKSDLSTNRLNARKRKIESLGNKTIVLIKSTNNFLLYKVSSNSKTSVIKLLKTKSPSEKDMTKLRNEFEITKAWNHPSIRSSYKKTSFQRRLGIELEWAKGISLDEVGKVPVNEFFIIARELMAGIQYLHQNFLIHTNICSQNIVYDERNKEIKIIGLSSCCSFRGNLDDIVVQDIKDKDLRFISPEQTSRIKREIDFRSDLYSIGVVFYKLLCGEFPFETDTPSELIKMHITTQSKPLSEVTREIPKPLSEMVSKLLNKNAEDRYSSVKGVIYDLELMSMEYKVDAQLQSVVVAQYDTSETLLLPQRLYGREKEYNTLTCALDKACSGSYEVVFVSGDSGSGKSSLVHELRKVASRRNCLFLSGKFDRGKQESYTAIIEAVSVFCDDVFLENSETIQKVKSSIKLALGDEGKILTNLIPKLTHLIGEQVDVGLALGKDARNRFNYVLIQFFKALSFDATPIILFLDDLQFMDTDSFNFLLNFLKERSIKNFLFVGTHREIKATAQHSLPNIFDMLTKNRLMFEEINLANVDLETVNEIVSDVLYVSPFESYSLSTFIFSKSKGNLYFVYEMLKMLQEQNIIFFSSALMRWCWDSLNFISADKVVEILREKILRYDKEIQQVVKIASCLGSPFSLPILKIVVNNNKSVSRLLSSGLVTRVWGSEVLYRFTHDQVNEAAYSLLPSDPKKLYLYIGNKLRHFLSEEDLDENVYVVSHLFLKSVSIVHDQDKRCEIASLLLLAGQKALSATAFVQAFQYLAKGIELLHAKCWETHFDLSLKLFGEAAKAAYSIDNVSLMNECIEIINQNASSPRQLVTPYILKIRCYSDLRQFEAAVSSCIFVLNKLGWSTEGKENDSAYVASNIEKVVSQLEKFSKDDVMKMKELTDEKIISIMTILSELLSSSLYTNPDLYSLITLEMIQLTLKFGVSKYAPYAFCCFGSILRETAGDEIGYRFGIIALELIEKYNIKEFIPKVLNCFYMQISPFYESVHSSISNLTKSYKIGLEIGSKVDCSIAGCAYTGLAMLNGRCLKNLMEDCEELEKEFGDCAPLGFSCFCHSIETLLSKEKFKPKLLSAEKFDYKVLYRENKGKSISARPLLCCGWISYIFCDFDAAIKFLNDCKELERIFLYTYAYSYLLFYHSLALIAVGIQNIDKTCVISMVEENLAKLKNLANNAPMNYLNKIYLIQAELNVFRGEKKKGEICYKKAISFSKEYGFEHEQAISCERLGEFYIKENSIEATLMILRAYDSYRKWGAIAKMNQIVKSYPSIFTVENMRSLDETEGTLHLPYDVLIDDGENDLISQVSLDETCNMSSYSP